MIWLINQNPVSDQHYNKFPSSDQWKIAINMQDCIVQEKLLGSESKPGRRRQRERQQAKDLMSKAIALHVRYKSLYIFPSSEKQQREMTKFWVACWLLYIMLLFPH